MVKIKISEDFSEYPGARYYEDGPDSGQQFYDRVLKDAYETSLQRQEKLVVDLDGTAGYASSFLSESFGRLAQTFGVKEVLNSSVKSSQSFQTVHILEATVGTSTG